MFKWGEWDLFIIYSNKHENPDHWSAITCVMLISCCRSLRLWTIIKEMFKFLITVRIDLQMCTHSTMRHLERIFNLPSRRGGFAVLKYSSEYSGKTARLIQLMPHCSLWIVPGSPGYLCWSIIIGCVTVSECDGPNRGSQGYSTPRCTIRRPLALHMGWKGERCFNFLNQPTLSTLLSCGGPVMPLLASMTAEGKSL